MPKKFLWGRTVGHLKVTLLIIENCGIFLCSQRAALLIHTAYAVLFFGCCRKKNRRRRRDKSRLIYSSLMICLAPGLVELFIYTLWVLVSSRADLRRHVNFVFPTTPQVFYWAYILIAH